MSNVTLILRKPWLGKGVNQEVTVPTRQADLMIQRSVAELKKKPRPKGRKKKSGKSLSEPFAT